MKRRVLSFLLALTLCFSLLPVSAMAEDAAASPSPAATALAEVKKDEPAPTAAPELIAEPVPTAEATPAPAATVEDEEDEEAARRMILSSCPSSLPATARPTASRP